MLKEKLAKLMEKKGGSTLDPAERSIRMDVLKKIKQKAGNSIAGTLGPKKVEVMSDSKDGLEEGLDKAKQLMGESEEDPKEMGAEDGITEDSEEASEDLSPEEMEELSPEEIDEKIKELLLLKAKLKA